jgi:FKBP-type peptidyl-prolyl cis-trans isomerase 2
MVLVAAAFIVTACASKTVQRGDYVTVTYTGAYQNGTVFDTNNPKLRADFPSLPAEHFAALPVLVGGGQVVPGFENAIVGMKKGETKTVTIKAKEAYGSYDASKTVSLPRQLIFGREVALNRTVVVPKAEFLNRTQSTIVIPGQTFDTQNFLYNITSVNATDISLYILNATHDPVQLEGVSWNSTLIRATPQSLVYRHDVREGDNYTTQYGPYTAHVNDTNILLTTVFKVGEQYQTNSGVARVTRESQDLVTLDFNPPLAGYDLTFNITVDTIQAKK